MVKANTGYGITRFLVPRFRELCKPLGIPVVRKLSVDRRVIRNQKTLRNGSVLLIEEPGSQRDVFTAEERYVKQLCESRPDIRIVFVHDPDTDAAFLAVMRSLTQRFGSMPEVNISPKLFNREQTAEYFAWGRPYHRYETKGLGYFEGVSDNNLLRAAGVYR